MSPKNQSSRKRHAGPAGEVTERRGVISNPLEEALRDLITTSGQTSYKLTPIPPIPELPSLPVAPAIRPNPYKQHDRIDREPDPNVFPNHGGMGVFLHSDRHPWMPFDDLRLINALCFRGRRRFDRPFRVLIAGIGTADSLIFLAMQLRAALGAEIFCIDTNRRLLQQGEARLRNHAIHWNDPRIERIVTFQIATADDMRPFDYIRIDGTCFESDLQSLAAMLHPDGAIGYSMRGALARTSVEPIRRMLHLLPPSGGNDTSRRFADLRLLLKSLPETNPHIRAGHRHDMTLDDAVLDERFLRDPGTIVSISELADLIADAGLHLATLAPMTRPFLDATLFPYPLPESLRKRLVALPVMKQAAILEILGGNIATFACYLTRELNTVCRMDEPGAIPFFGPEAERQKLPHRIRGHQPKDPVLTATIGTVIQNLSIPVNTAPLCRAFYTAIDGFTSYDTIIDKVANVFPGETPAVIRDTIWRCTELLREHRLLLARHCDSNIDPLCH